jgi:hypothetical protein
MITDNHGVPTHEWCQQFAGYTSPWFKGFWMPRALLYGYFWYLTNEEFAPNKKLAKAVEEAVASVIGADKECDALNKLWRERFEKYAHAWMPKLFLADYHKGMINYWVPSDKTNKESNYASVKFPQVTAVHFVSEVSDETARDDYLKLCARTHELNDLAIINMLKECRTVIQNSVKTVDGILQCSRRRIRPLETFLGGKDD